jgi:hypothetical protein
MVLIMAAETARDGLSGLCRAVTCILTGLATPALASPAHPRSFLSPSPLTSLPAATYPLLRLCVALFRAPGEEALMALDYYAYTGDPSYLHIAFATGDFLVQHFTNRSSDGHVVIWPAQVLETYWCNYGAYFPRSLYFFAMLAGFALEHHVYCTVADPSNGFTNCCEDDAPTVSAMMAVLEKLLALPDELTTPAQRAAWSAFVAIMPALPTTGSPSVIAPARVLSSG